MIAKRKIHLFIIAIVIFASNLSFAQTKNGYATMVVVQSGSGVGIKSKILISTGLSGTEQIDLKDMGKMENVVSNTEAISEAMNRLKSNGYKLISSNSCPISQNIQYATYIFLKE